MHWLDRMTSTDEYKCWVYKAAAATESYRSRVSSTVGHIWDWLHDGAWLNGRFLHQAASITTIASVWPVSACLAQLEHTSHETIDWSCVVIHAAKHWWTNEWNTVLTDSTNMSPTDRLTSRHRWITVHVSFTTVTVLS